MGDVPKISTEAALGAVEAAGQAIDNATKDLYGRSTTKKAGVEAAQSADTKGKFDAQTTVAASIGNTERAAGVNAHSIDVVFQGYVTRINGLGYVGQNNGPEESKAQLAKEILDKFPNPNAAARPSPDATFTNVEALPVEGELGQKMTRIRIEWNEQNPKGGIIPCHQEITM